MSGFGLQWFEEGKTQARGLSKRERKGDTTIDQMI